MPDISGRDPTPETIRQGTVRMEAHPQYAQTLAYIEQQKFKIVFTPDAPCVVIRDVVDEQGSTLRMEREVQVRRGMPFLDLEHELGHLEQITQRLKNAMLPTERVLESGRPSKYKHALHTEWMDDICEYHNRLVEYQRLCERGVDTDVLELHAQGARRWREAYYRIVRAARYGSSQKSERLKWAQTYFPDIVALEEAYRKAGGEENEQDLR